jgi:transcriptional regulator with XRE-family HTH domain
MQKQLEKIEIELANRIFKLFIVKFDGNKSAFARAAQCQETTIRRIFRNQQGITFNLLLRLAFALEVPVSDLIKNLEVKKIIFTIIYYFTLLNPKFYIFYLFVLVILQMPNL